MSQRGGAFRIEYTPEATGHLAGLTAHQSALVLDEVERKLRHQPTLPAKNRKLLRANPVAPWELRIGELRVYFDVEESPAAWSPYGLSGSRFASECSSAARRRSSDEDDRDG
jgi:mRNA-degrading endonuclease RelE of RelBE toxin-antitoxin system